MKHRTFVKHLGFTDGALTLRPADLLFPGTDSLATGTPAGKLKRLRDEAPCYSEVRVERGAPRLFINNRETPPFFALSTMLEHTAGNFRRMGVSTLFPIIGMRSFWPGPGRYEWAVLEAYLARLLTLDPDARLFLRLHLHSPAWWTEAHPAECIRYGLPTPEKGYDLLKHDQLKPIDGGHFMDSGGELREASFASEVWRRDTAAMLQSLVRYMEQSPLRSRVMGYFLMDGGSGEWNAFGADFMPDYSAPMERTAGPLAPVRDRLFTSYGLLRDPATEQPVIDFYRRYHQVGAETVAHLARAIKEALVRPLICGTFYAYLMEVSHIQDSGFLAPQKVIDSPHIDLVAGPYSYQSTNEENRPQWESDMYDGADNWLGRARGVGGDGAFRLMVASLHRRGKLYASEIDPSTYLDAKDGWRGIGGSGSKSEEGSINILRRDIGKVFAEGVGGWLYDFGPLFDVDTGWYGSESLIAAIKPLMTLMEKRQTLDLSPVAETAMLADTDSFFATRHWLANKPWPGQGIRHTDFINHWFLNSQNRALQRLGAPVDYLYRSDLTAQDARRYKLLLVPNSFLLQADEVEALHEILRGSGTTVVWYYAPGLLRTDAIDLEQMTRLTGFEFSERVEPGPLMIQTTADDGLPQAFGVKSPDYYSPRFAVTSREAEVLGYWQDDKRAVAFARKAMDGWTSVYVGTAPLPAEWLRRLAAEAGVALWSTQPDVVSGTRGTAMLVATSDGIRTLTLPDAMAPADGGPARKEHTLNLTFGDVCLFHIAS